MKNKAVVETASKLIKIFDTKDPFVIAEKLGIPVEYRKYNENVKGYCYKVYDKLYIIINSNLDKKAQTIICAHELGHAVLHANELRPIFSAAFEKDAISSPIEFEANIFAAALLLDEDELNTKISNMSNYLIRGIFDYNF